MTPEEHLENLVRHIGLVRDACLLMGRRLIAQGRQDFGRQLVARGLVHDASKFEGIEWEYLHNIDGVPARCLEMAIAQHHRGNDHHPEFWGGLDKMPEICVAEMVCDWYARSQEFGTNLRDWIKTNAARRYNIDLQSEQCRWINGFVEILLAKPFDS